MAFSEKIKKEVREKADFRCCICRAVGIEIHHIIPQEQDGPDTIDNAAPLCPSHHEDFGDNPKKRKIIKEMRDWWYRKVAEMFPQKTTETELLQKISDQITSLSQGQREGLNRQVSQTIPPGSVIKGSLDTLHWYAREDGKRYVFPTNETFTTWFPLQGPQPKIHTISDNELASIPIGGNVTYRPGSRLIKIKTDPTIYAVSQGAVLRCVESTELANKLFGDNWKSLIDVMPDPFFVNYVIASKIRAIDDYDPATEFAISSLP